MIAKIDGTFFLCSQHKRRDAWFVPCEYSRIQPRHSLLARRFHNHGTVGTSSSFYFIKIARNGETYRDVWRGDAVKNLRRDERDEKNREEVEVECYLKLCTSVAWTKVHGLSRTDLPSLVTREPKDSQRRIIHIYICEWNTHTDRTHLLNTSSFDVTSRFQRRGRSKYNFSRQHIVAGEIN